MIIFPIAILAVIVFLAFSEGKRIGAYKVFGIFGRCYAYFTCTFLMGGVMLCLSPVLAIAAKEGIAQSFLALIPGAALLFVGVKMCQSVHKKCGRIMPKLQKQCVRDLILCGLGLAAKIAFFFIGAVWAFVGPREVTDSNGNTLYVMGSDVHDGSGRIVGTLDSADTFIPNKDYEHANSL